MSKLNSAETDSSRTLTREIIDELMKNGAVIEIYEFGSSFVRHSSLLTPIDAKTANGIYTDAKHGARKNGMALTLSRHIGRTPSVYTIRLRPAKVGA